MLSKEYRKITLGGMAFSVLAAGILTGLTACGSSAGEGAGQQMTAESADRPDEELQDGEGEQSQEEYVDKPDRSKEGLTLIWNDEFDGNSLDTSKWDYQYGTGAEYGLEGWGNSELEYYTDRAENVRVEDGKLIITAIKEDTPYQGMNYTSGRIRTMTRDNEELFSVTYGRIEARIRMPEGEGIWPAFWMLPVDESIYGGWAASGEIDIMEARGRLPQMVGGTLHFGKVWPDNTYKTKDYIFPEETDITDFHVYSLEWEPGVMRWYVDDECYFTLDKWFSQGKVSATEYTSPAPYDVPFYILLDLAVGGTYDPEANVRNAEFPAQMEVDFVRVYQKEEGYKAAEEKSVNDTLDTEGFAAYAESYTDGEFIADREFATMNTEAIKNTDTGIIPENKDWQFAVGNFGGAASASVEELAEGSFARVDITSPGNQTYSVQLIQHLPVIEGYTYQVSFDAKASKERSFVVSPSGDGDNSWVKYATYEARVKEETESYSFTFKMNSVTDPTARLEFNIGKDTGSVWIGNVSVTLVNTQGGVDDDMIKTPLRGGHLVYNGTFDQGNGRLAFWHTQDLEAVVPDFVIDSEGKADYSRRAELTAKGEEPRLYQTGIQLQTQTEYLLSIELGGEAGTEVGVTITGDDGTVILSEVCILTSDEDEQFSFEVSLKAAADEKNGTLSISLPADGKIRIDNVKLRKV